MASNPSKPTVLFIPGAWHGVEGYANVMVQLQAAGYPTISVALPSVDAPTALQSLDEDVKAIRKAIIGATQRGQEVIVVCHSYSGVPASQAVENLQKGGKDTGGSGGVVLLFYCTAFIMPMGVSMMEGLGGQDLPWWRTEGDHVYPVTPEKILYNDMSEEQQKVWSASLRSFSKPMFSNRLSYTGYKDIPSAFLFCTQDNAIPLEIQQGMVKGSGVDMYTETLECSHSPFLSQPKAMADAIRRAAGEKV